MNIRRFLHRFFMRGVFWRQYLGWGVSNVPAYLELLVEWVYTTFFFIVWVPGRCSVARNLNAILPESPRWLNHLRGFAVFWNFAWTFTDTARFNERRTMVDWEFDGIENLRLLHERREGCIILTAHMGNYDLGSYLFAEKLKRPLITIRVPETDVDSEAYSSNQRKRVSNDLKVSYNTSPTALAIELVQELRDGGIIAIQGDRVLHGVAGAETTLFGHRVDLPTGPFALAMASQAPIYPLFVTRVGRRRYRVTTYPPIYCRRTGRDRSLDLEVAAQKWRTILEEMIRRNWAQWYTFIPFMKETAA